MTASPKSYDLIKQFEDGAGFHLGRCTKLKAYLCPSGIWTIGWGHTTGIVEGMSITPEMADALLLEDVLAVEADLRAVFPGVTFSQGQWDALVALGFNMAGGPKAFPHKAPKMTAAIRIGNREEAARQMLDINKGRSPDGQLVELAGLTRRRQAEAALFLAAA